MTQAISLRPATEADSDFAYRAHRDAMGEYAIATFGKWDEDAVRKRASDNIANGSTRIIELDGVPIGIRVVEREPDFIQLAQLFILPGYQRRGIGSMLLEQLLADAKSARLPLRLRVLRVNPAFALYQRMGFQVVQETPERYFMEWLP